MRYRAFGLLLLLSVGALAAPDKERPLPDHKEVWRSARSTTLNFISQTSDKETRDYAEHFDCLRKVVRGISPLLRQGWMEVDATEPTVVYVFRDSEAFLRYNDRKQVSGYFIHTPFANLISLDASRDDDRRVASHEFIHHVLRQNFPRLPLWLNEGLAEYFSTLKKQGNEVRVGEITAELFHTLTTIGPMPVEQLLKVTHDTHSWEEERKTRQVYATAWLLIHSLLGQEESLRSTFGHYLARLKEGVDPDMAFTEAFGNRIQSLQEQMTSYLKTVRRRGAIPIRIFTLADLQSETPPAFEPRALTRADGIAHLGLLACAALRSEPEFAQRHFRAALSLDPICGLAKFGQGIQLWEQNQHEQAYPLLQEAAEQAPDEAAVQLLAGKLLVIKADRTHALEDWRTARAILLRGLAMHKGNLMAIRMLARTYEDDGERRAQGEAILERACKARPDLSELKILLGHLKAKAGDGKGARDLYSAAAGDPRLTPDLAREARLHLEALGHNETWGRSKASEDAFRKGVETYNAGDHQAGLQAMDAAVEQEPDPTLKSRKRAEVARLREERACLDTFNQGVALFNAGEREPGLKAMEQAVTRAQDPQRRESMRAEVGRLRASMTGPKGGQASRADTRAASNAASEGLRFRLPAHYRELGQEVMRLVAEQESVVPAIRRVEEALTRAKRADDRKALQSLLELLKARQRAITTS